MVVHVVASPSDGASVDGDGAEDEDADAAKDEDADLLPLSSIFPVWGPQRVLSKGERDQRKPSNDASVGSAGAPEGSGKLRRGRGLPELEGGCGVSAPGDRRGFGNGDLVWAKAFPYTWWPGLVRESRGTVLLVSLFGGDKSLWLEESSICGFEEDYVRMSKMAGARLACQVDCALAELGRRATLGMGCGCRHVVGLEDENLITQIARERERFKPAEMLGFVLSLAVCAWVDDGQIVRAVRVASQVNAYRIHVSTARRAEVNGGFQQEEALDTARRLAGSALVDDEAGGGMARGVAYPDWFYQSPAEESDSSTSCSAGEDSEGTELEMPFISLFENEEAKDPDSLYEDVSSEQDEKDSMMQEEVQHNGELCVINRIDYSVLISDMEFEPLSDNEMENVPCWSEEKGMAFVNDVSNSSCRYASCLDGFHGKEFDQSVPPDSSIEMYKPVDFSLTDASTSSSLEFTTENGSQIIIDSPLKDQPSMVAGLFQGEEGSFQVLHEMLHYLYCLACDPLHMRSESLLPFLQLVLSYRTSTFQNISSFSSMICLEETQKPQDRDVQGNHDLTNEDGEKQQDGRIADMCEHCSIAGVLFHSHDDRLELLSSAECHCNLHMPHVTRDSITTDSSIDISDTNKTVDSKHSVGVKFPLNAERRHSGRILVDNMYSVSSCEVIKGVSPLTFPVSHDYKVVGQKRRFEQEATSATSSNLHTVNCLGSDVKASTVSMMLLDNMRCKDIKTFSIKQSDMNDETEILTRDDASYRAATIQASSNFSAASANAPQNNIESKTIICSSDLPSTCKHDASSGRKRMLGQPVQSYISKWQKDYHFTLATRLYASPLVRDSSSESNRTQCSPVIGRITGPSTSLHMKFPRGCNLPSKEELEKIFRVFGPLDHSRTRVFFYTGAGKVVFLNPIDTETAYNYVRKNRIFETGMRFWLDAYENTRKDYRTQTLSLSGGQVPALGLKSCLKTSSIHENEDMKKKHRVRFSI